MITQKALDRLADVYQTIGWDIEFHLGEPVEGSYCRKVRIFQNGKLVHTTLVDDNGDDNYDLLSIENLAITINELFENGVLCFSDKEEADGV